MKQNMGKALSKITINSGHKWMIHSTQTQARYPALVTMKVMTLRSRCMFALTPLIGAGVTIALSCLCWLRASAAWIKRAYNVIRVCQWFHSLTLDPHAIRLTLFLMNDTHNKRPLPDPLTRSFAWMSMSIRPELWCPCQFYPVKYAKNHW